MNKEFYLIPIAIICCILLFGTDIQLAYGATVTSIEPTGGTLADTADCTDVTGGNDIIWLNCSDTSTLYAINDSTFAVIAEVVTSASLNRLQACTVGSCVYLLDPTANRVSKYELSGVTITRTAFWDAPCNIDAEFNYDSEGFLWGLCLATDRIVRLNPATMVTALDDEINGVCQPTKVSYSSQDLKGVLYCTNGGGADSLILFSKGASTVTVLDEEITTSGQVNVMIDGGHNRVATVTTNTLTSWTYTDGGVLTLATTIIAGNMDFCDIEPFFITSTQDMFIVCSLPANPDTIIRFFKLNSTAIYHVGNSAIAFNDVNAIGLDPHDGIDSLPVWYMSSSTNNDNIIRIEGVRALDDAPDPIGGDGDDDPEGNDPEDTDTDGDTIPNSEDDDIDGDTIPNSQDGDIDGDGIPNADDDTPCGSNSCIVNETCVFGTALQCTSNSEGDSNFSVQDLGNRFGCMLGVLECVNGEPTNDDIKTNGVGWAISAIAFGLLIAMIFVATKGDLGAIPSFVWFVASLALLGMLVAFGIIDSLFFIISIVAIIAIFAGKTLTGLFMGGRF